MHTGNELPLAKQTELMGGIIIEMSQKGFGCVGIIDNDKKLVGIISDGDLRRHMSVSLLKHPAEKIMTKTPYVIEEKKLITKAMEVMNQHKITVLFIVDEGENLVGILHMHDC